MSASYFSFATTRGLRRNGEKGGANFKTILSLLILVSMVYTGFKVVPVLINEYQFQDGIKTIAQFGTAERRTADQIRTAVMDAAQKNEVPVQAEDVKVEATNGNVSINVDYSVTVDLAVYHWTLNFHPSSHNDALF